MIIHIHRGQNQIGGSIIEIRDEHTRLFFDIGINLTESGDPDVPPIEGVFCGKADCAGVFVSHYHADHIGLAEKLLDGIPLYMGQKAYGILKAAAEYRGDTVPFVPQSVRHGEPITLGDFTVTPFSCDHSAFDSYMYRIENGGKSVLYTGDFRANGRADFEALLRVLPEADVLITEGTTLTRNNRQNIPEEQLEDIASTFLTGKNGPAFIMMSAQNIDRLTTAQHAAAQNGRTLLLDIYTAKIAKACALLPEEARVFMTGGDRQYEQLQEFSDQKIGKYAIAETPFLMCIRQSMLHYLEKLSELVDFQGGVLFYAMWKGYMDQPDMRAFLDFMIAKGVKVHVLHTSGHADAATIDQLIQTVNPHRIVPVHTENAAWFEQYEPTVCIDKDIEITV